MDQLLWWQPPVLHHPGGHATRPTPLRSCGRTLLSSAFGSLLDGLGCARQRLLSQLSAGHERHRLRGAPRHGQLRLRLNTLKGVCRSHIVETSCTAPKGHGCPFDALTLGRQPFLGSVRDHELSAFSHSNEQNIRKQFVGLLRSEERRAMESGTALTLTILI